jgi:hypothetical protein
MAPEFHASKLASMADLLAGSKEGWRLNQEGKRIRSELDPILLVAHFRRIRAQWCRIPHPARGWLSVNREVLLPVLWLALRERGWTIDRQDAMDAWILAAFTPAPVDEGGDPF